MRLLMFTLALVFSAALAAPVPEDPTPECQRFPKGTGIIMFTSEDVKAQLDEGQQRIRIENELIAN